MILRLRHVCGRNLADATLPAIGGRLMSDRQVGVVAQPANPDWTPDGLRVRKRPGVDMDVYRHWHEKNAGRYSGAKAEDWRARTYTWRCRCDGKPLSLAHERISAMWAEESANPRRVVTRVIS